uniref:Uncharacterized protein n=1 Tax=Romanomermis culicivorax TaxID=13658 RepID=A0A915KNP0_ROMCU
MSTKLPRCGSVYFYAYANLGELLAFFLGWICFVDYSAFSALIFKSWSDYANHLFTKPTGYFSLGYVVSSSQRFTPMKITSVTATTMKLTSANLTDLNTTPFWDGKIDFLMIFVLLASTIFAISSVRIIRATLLLLRAFSNIETTSFLTEEVTNTSGNFPWIVPLCNIILFIFFFLICLVISLVLPYVDLPSQFILPNIFNMINVPASRYVTSVGAVCCLSGASLAVALPAARILFAMGQDGLLCPAFGFLMGKKGGAPIVGHMTAFLITLAFIFMENDHLLYLTLVTVPIRWSICTYAALLDRYKSTPVGLPAEVADYRRMHKLRSIASFFSSRVTSVGTADTSKLMDNIGRPLKRKDLNKNNSPEYSDDSKTEEGDLVGPSASSSFFNNVACDQQGVNLIGHGKISSTTLQVPGIRRSRSSGWSSNMSEESFARSISSDNNDRFLFLENADVSMQSISFSDIVNENDHNCFRSPCSPCADSMQTPHVFDREDHGAIPSHVENFSMKPCESNFALNAVPIYRKAINRSLICSISMALLSIILTKFWSSLMKDYRIMIATGVLTLVVLVGSILFVLLPQNTDGYLKNKVPASPCLSILNLFLLILTMVAADLDGFLRLVIIFAPGLLLYIAYSYKHSHENVLQPPKTKISLTNSDFQENKTILRHFSDARSRQQKDSETSMQANITADP